jgi:hypothetical protein
MAKLTVSDWDTTAANNTDINSIPIDGAVTTPSQVDNIFREMMAQIKEFSLFSSLTMNGTDAGAGVGPVLSLYRNSATPAVSDVLGQVRFDGEDSAGNLQTYSDIFTQILDPTSGSEDGQLHFRTVIAGTSTTQALVTPTGWNSMNIGATTPGTGAFTSCTASTHTATSAFVGANSSTNAILATTGAGLIFLRPNGAASTTGQIEIDSGSIEVGDFASNGASAGKLIQAPNMSSSTTLTTTVTHQSFNNPNGQVGAVNTSGSSTSYATSSDERLKENFTSFDGGALLDDINVYRFDWKAGGSGYGVKAQECHAVFPDAISVGGEDVSEPWAADYSKFVPLLMAEVKALRARVAELEA